MGLFNLFSKPEGYWIKMRREALEEDLDEYEGIEDADY